MANSNKNGQFSGSRGPRYYWGLYAGQLISSPPCIGDDLINIFFNFCRKSLSSNFWSGVLMSSVKRANCMLSAPNIVHSSGRRKYIQAEFLQRKVLRSLKRKFNCFQKIMKHKGNLRTSDNVSTFSVVQGSLKFFW